MIELLPFSKKHLESFEPGVEETRVLGESFTIQEWLEGRALALIEEGKTLGICAVILIPGHDPHIAAALSDDLRSRPFLLHRTARRVLAAIVDYYRIPAMETAVRVGDEAGLRWAERLGFKQIEEQSGFYLMGWSA